ncbi:MAG: BlaI/MecI/CopY family transcriptional regulator [Cyclobacteriaceae bacterium]
MGKLPKPTEKELEILQVLWKEGASTVRQINDVLSESRDVGYTTTLKFLQIMHEKGLVIREKQGKTHIYSASLSESQAQQSLVKDLLDSAFKGSAMKLVMGALGSKKSSKKELDEIRKYLDELEGGEK